MDDDDEPMADYPLFVPDSATDGDPDLGLLFGLFLGLLFWVALLAWLL